MEKNNMVVKIKLTKEQEELLYTIATLVHTEEDNVYIYIPFWFKDIGNHNYEIHATGKIPQDLTNELKDLRHLQDE